MLEIRPCCEQCGKSLSNTSSDAMICSFECTYCQDCAINTFENICPSCGGNFQSRPIRPSQMLAKYPASLKRVYVPKDQAQINKMQTKYKFLKPERR